jgi:hypothetical protein
VVVANDLIFHPLRGLFLLRFSTHGLRRGLQSDAASRLESYSTAVS